MDRQNQTSSRGHQDSDATSGLLTIPEAAAQAGVSITTIKGWLAIGRLRSVRLDRQRIDPADLAATRERWHLGEVVPVWRRERQRVGRRLRELREAAGLSQLSLAARTDLTHEAISRLEVGRWAPRADTVRKLAEGLRIDPAEFISQDPIGERQLTVAEAATWLDVPAGRVQTWVRTGELPGHKVSGQWRIPALAVTALERSGRMRGNSRRLDPRYHG